MTYLSINNDYPLWKRDPFRFFWNDLVAPETISTLFAPSYQTAHFEVTDTEKGYILTMDLPGFKREEIDLTLKDRHLTVRAKHGSRMVDRTIVLGSDIDAATITAKLEDGVLSITVDRTPEAAPRKVLIT